MTNCRPDEAGFFAEVAGTAVEANFRLGVSMATYTTAALVKARVENIDSGLTDATVEDFIEAAESIVDGLMGTSFIATFDATKHGILREAATVYGAMAAMAFQPAGFSDLQEATLILDVLAFQWSFITTELRGNRDLTIYLEGL